LRSSRVTFTLGFGFGAAVGSSVLVAPGTEVGAGVGSGAGCGAGSTTGGATAGGAGVVLGAGVTGAAEAAEPAAPATPAEVRAFRPLPVGASAVAVPFPPTETFGPPGAGGVAGCVTSGPSIAMSPPAGTASGPSP
jgi:hypothetical protein